MKQHITRSDWNELSDKDLTIFMMIVEGLRMRVGTLFGKKIHSVWEDPEFIPPNIGHMIEFLGYNWHKYLLQDYYLTRDSYCRPIVPDAFYIPENKELCDKLWEACKHKLTII